MLVSFQIGVSGRRSAPALKRWISLRFLAILGLDGSEESVARMVVSFQYSNGADQRELDDRRSSLEGIPSGTDVISNAFPFRNVICLYTNST